MNQRKKNPVYRYVSDLARFDAASEQFRNLRGVVVPIGLSVVFLALVGLLVGGSQYEINKDWLVVVVAAVVGGYMALNIGANDVANNMGPAVGGKVLTIMAAIVIAAVCESAGALLAGGDVVATVSKGIITPGDTIGIEQFRNLMLSALFAAALWINIATILNAPVSTTHSIVGGVMGAGIAAAGGIDLVNWGMMAKIVASWIISPIFGAVCAALVLYFIKCRILNVDDRRAAARRWVPWLMALMACAFTAYMLLKGFKKIWHPSVVEIVVISLLALGLVYAISRPYIARRVAKLPDRKKSIQGLFDVPLIAGAALLSFAHGANDVANAVGPLAAIVSTVTGGAGAAGGAVAAKVTIPLWVMAVGAFGIALGLGLFGPKLIGVVGEQITRLNPARAYCVALSAAVTVLIATTLGLPVSSTHIALGAVFGVGFLREFMESPNRRKLRPVHKLNPTAAAAFNSRSVRSQRRLVRRRYVLSIAAAWVVTVPASAVLAALVYQLLRLL